MKPHDLTDEDIRLQQTLQRWSRYLTLATLLIALLVFLGWQFNIGFFKQPIPTLAPMNPLTVICFLCIGSAFFIFDLKLHDRIAYTSGITLLAVTLVIGMLRIMEAYNVIQFQIDLMLFQDRLSTHDFGTGPSRMAVNTAISFILLSISIISLHGKREKNKVISNYAAGIVFLVALFSLIGYLYKVREFYDFLSFYPMAFNTTIAFLLISIAIIFYHPTSSFSILARSNTGGVIARMLIPVAVLIPIVVGHLRLLLHWQKTINVEFGVASVVLAIIIAFVAFVLYASRIISNKDTLQNIAEAKFNGILESAPDSMVIMDEAGIIQIVNAQTEQLFGFEKNQLMGQSVSILIPQYTTPHRSEFFVEGGIGKEIKGLELSGKKKNGSEFPLEISFRPLKTEEGILVSAAIRDITERKKAEETNRFLATIATNILDPVITFDSYGGITRWNRAAEKLMEWKSEEVVGKNINDVLDVIYMGQSREKIRAAFLETGFWQGEVIYHTKSGKPIHVYATVSQLRDAADQVTGQLILVRDITDRKKAEEKLRQFQHFFSNSNDFFAIANTEGHFEIVNPSFNRVLGYSNNELSELQFLEFVHPDDIQPTQQTYQKLKSGLTITLFINRYRKKDGTYLWLDWSATPDPDTGKMYCIARDFTDRKMAEDALKKLNDELEQEVKRRIREIEKNERRFQVLVENNHDIVSLMDESFKVIYRSPSGYRITGWSNDELANLSGTVNIHPDDLEYAKGFVVEMMNNPGKAIDTLFRNRHKDGHYLWVQGTITNLLHDESVKAIVFNFRDVTQRKKLEDLLNKANTLARIGGWEVDRIKGTVYWTDITREIHETEPDYIPSIQSGVKFYKEGEARDLISQKINEAIKSGTPWDIEVQLVTAKNNERWVRVIGEAEFIDGVCVRLYGSFQDITERKEVAKKLEQQNKELRKANSELDRFVYSASHDLRAPLKSLLGLITLSDAEIGPDNQALHQKLEMMNRSVLKLDNFIEEILHYARNARVDLVTEEIKFEEIIQDINGTLKFIEEARDLRVTIVIDQKEKFISDKQRVNVILNNLISNAMKYKDPSKEKSFLNITIQSNNMDARIEVADNGIGIEEENHKRIFEMFYRATVLSTGSGLGLYIVSEVVDRLGGSIALESEIGKGTKMIVTIPNLITSLN